MEKLIRLKIAYMEKITLLLCLLACLTNLNAQQKTGMFDGNEDVGNPVKKGSATYNPKHRNTL
jgi:hypothetical protein